MPAGAKFGGRKPGTPNKITAEVRALAQQYSPAAFAELARLATQATSEQARVAAIKEILDRAYGKSPQALEVTGEGGAPLAAVINVTIAGA